VQNNTPRWPQLAPVFIRGPQHPRRNRSIGEVGECGEEHQVRVSSNASILGWLGLGLALVALTVWLANLYAALTIASGPLALAAVATGFAKWRENRWLTGPTR
jgi:hypothetical protein